VFSIGVEPNGSNINDQVGSTSPAAVCAKVKELRADIGIALDGDADRVLIVDEKGDVVDGDQFMAVITQSWAERGLLRGGGMVATVMSNLGLERYLNSIDLNLERTQVGDRYVLEMMRAKGYNIGGEQSGHVILSDFTTTGDGLVAALQLLAVAQAEQRPVSEVCNRFEKVPQLLNNVRFKKGKPLDNKLVKQVIKEGKSRLAEQGRLVIRESGTEPLIRVMGEGDDEKLISDVVRDIAEAIRQVA
jgi:phosphoglucosamine mutase